METGYDNQKMHKKISEVQEINQVQIVPYKIIKSTMMCRRNRF
jgi:hypothetical protein